MREPRQTKQKNRSSLKHGIEHLLMESLESRILMSATTPGVTGRFLVYGGTSALGDSIALDKTALLPGQAANFANVSSYMGGINEVAVDVNNAAPSYTAGDFTFLVGNSSDPSTWSAAPVPASMTTVPGAGISGSTRVYLRWADGAIQNQWLQVNFTPAADTFFVGSLVGATSNLTVTAADEMAIQGNFSTLFSPPIPCNPYDVTRDGKVDTIDQLTARAETGNSLTVLSSTTTMAAAMRIHTPTAPTDLAATVTSATQITLTWTDDSSNETGFVIERQVAGGSWTILASVAAGLTTYGDSAVVAGTQYSYRVSATNGVWTSSASNTATATAPADNPVTLTQSAQGDLTRLTITGTTGNDSIIVSQSGTTLSILANGVTTEIATTIGEIAIYSSGGNDVITVQASVALPALLYGGLGASTLTALSSVKSFIVTVGGGVNTLVGNALTSFWANPADSITGGTTTNVHRVASFYQPFSSDPANAAYIPLTLTGQNLPDPTDSGTTVRLSNSLWGVGPTMTDINQGSVGDCYFLAPLQSLAFSQPLSLQERAVDLGDGTYAVAFGSGSAATYVRVDGDLPTGSWSGLNYAHPKNGGPIWACIIEKAYAFCRRGTNTYSSLASGWTGAAFSDLGVETTMYTAAGIAVFNTLTTALANQKAITVSSKTSIAKGVSIIAGHAYTVTATYVNAGVQYITLRNPWGYDGAGSDGNTTDGLVTLTLAQFRSNFSSGSIQI